MANNNNFHKYNANYVLKDYFKDRDTYNFKHGLEFGLSSNLSSSPTGNAKMNLDEDPTIFGFDMIILDKSPLFNQIDSFIDLGYDNDIQEIKGRDELYNMFIMQFSKFFNVDDRDSSRGDFKTDGRFNSFKTHYLKGVKGLDKLIHHTGMGYEEGKRQMTEFGKDKITFNLSEDVGINAGYLSNLYRTLVYSKKNGRQVIPENLLRFDMAIIVSEVRKFNRVSNALAESMKNETESISTFNDNISRYIFRLYDCQLDFNNFSFSDSINQGDSMNVSEGLEFDVYYKYVGLEMEKFDFAPDNVDNIWYLNDQRNYPTSYQINPDLDSSINRDTSALKDDKSPNRPMDWKYLMNSTINSVDQKEYEFDFPMVKSNYQKVEMRVRDENEKIEDDQGSFKKGLNFLIQRTNEQLQTKFIQARSKLISGLASKIRSATGLRNISAPDNVYAGTNLAQFALGKITDFANLAVGTALSKGAGFLNEKSQGMENSVFDIANRGVNKAKGLGDVPDSAGDKTSGGDIPNVYE